MSYSNTAQGSADLNQAATHDTSLYDPTIHDNQIVALYDTDTQAHTAKEMLVASGFSAAALQVLARDAAPASATTDAASTHPAADTEGLWGAIRSLFVPDEERTTFNTAIAHGHAMLVVTPDHTMDRTHLIHLIESTGPLDFDAKLEEWRQAGYDSSSAMTSATTGTPSMTPGVIADHTVTAPTPAPVMATPAPAPTLLATAEAAVGETIKVMEEKLRVGKREVASGAVRVRSYIVERPVSEQVRLHEERIDIQRTPVDRPATGTEFNAFQDRTIEARATSEEAVIARDVRVIEEIALNKQATDRVETVHDTVRKTKVEIEGADAATAHGTLPGKVGSNPNATPDAATSGANSPRK